MHQNVGFFDRILRVVVAIVLASAVLGGALSGVALVAWLVFPVVIFATAVVGSCPFYALLGIDTCHAHHG